MDAEYHEKELNKHCRVCAGSLSRHRVSYKCTTNSETLKATFGVLIDSDEESIHPRSFCHSCYTVMIRHTQSVEQKKQYQHNTHVFTWSPHGSSCPVCDHFKKNSKGGRRKKLKIGRPLKISVRSAIKHIKSVSAQSFKKPPGYNIVLPCHIADETDILCPLCTKVVESPILISACNNMICSQCCCNALEESGELLCPCCGDEHMKDFSHINKPPPAMLKLLNKLEVRCDQCSRKVQIANFQCHVSTDCQEGIQLDSPNSSLSDLIHTSQDVPLSSDENKLTTALMKRKLADNTVIHLKTGGQPMTLIKVTRPRRDSSEVSEKTVHTRSREIESHRQLTSGGESSFQFSNEIKMCPKEKRRLILDQLSGNSFRITLNSEQSLALKADLGIPWSKLRVIRRWFKEWKVEITSEVKMRKRAAELVGDRVNAELVPMSFSCPDGGGDEIRLTPYAYLSSIWESVQHMLDNYDRLGCLYWHNGCIPEDQVWLKIGGDKGGPSTKLSYQIVNVRHPNSPNNTCVFSIFEAKDSLANLKVAADMFSDEVNSLETQTWRGKSIKVFYSRDYEFETRSFGISGASGRHCCLWCHIKSVDLKTPPQTRGPVTPRSLTTLSRDLQNFEQSGGDMSQVKYFNNVCHKPFFNIPLNQVCPPGLHVSLGIYYRLFSLLEEECHELDLAHNLQGATSGRSYTQCVESAREKNLLEAKVHQLESDISNLKQMVTLFVLTQSAPQSMVLRSLSTTIAAKQRDIDKMKTEIEQHAMILTKGFKKEDGPFVRALDIALSKFNVQRQAYYSGSFIGNHVHRALREENVKSLCESIVDVARQHCLTILPQAQVIADKHQRSFLLFEKCHSLYESTTVDDEDIDVLSHNITNFMDYYRTTFSAATVLPKMHILEEHVISWLKEWKLGFGLMGEQGAESIHAHFNSLQRTYCSIPDKTKRLKQVLVEHALHVHPENTTARPEIQKKRKLTVLA